MTEETLKKYLEAKGVRKDSSFKVPEGYFDTLCDRVMQQLPEQNVQKKPARTIALHVWRYVAAIVVVALVVTISILVPQLRKQDNKELAKSAEITNTNIDKAYQDDKYADEALDYAMVENNEIADYLTE